MSGTILVQRSRQRIAVQIPVVITTVLDSLDATVADLTEFGAMITGISLPKGTLFQLDYEGHSVYARVMWDEVDRMGVRFPFDLREGPLFDALMRARENHLRGSDAFPISGQMNAGIPAPGFGRAAPPARFGRRM